MILSHEHRFVFVKTRKTAGTSVEIALSRICGPDDVITPISPEDEQLRQEYGGRPPQNVEAPSLPRNAFNHMPVTMVRRLIGRRRFESYFSFAIERNPWDAVVSLYHWRERTTELGPFADYVRSPSIESFARRNQRVYRMADRVAVDRVIRYETLADDLGRIWSELSLPGSPDLPHAKAGVRPEGRTYASYYDNATRQRVADLFAAPIAELGYTF